MFTLLYILLALSVIILVHFVVNTGKNGTYRSPLRKLRNRYHNRQEAPRV